MKRSSRVEVLKIRADSLDSFIQSHNITAPLSPHLALILAHGEPPTLELFLWHRVRAGLLIALDGGANWLAEQLQTHPEHLHWLTPDVILGDLDSYRPDSFPELTALHDPDQESNDLEKGLKYVLSRGMERAVVLGATGKRLDHTLKNLSVLKRFSASLPLHLEERDMTLALLTDEQPVGEVEGEPGQAVSLFPLSGRVNAVHTEGLKYPLHHEPLENGVRDGTSNALSGKTARISIEGGDLLVMVNRLEVSPARVKESP